MQLAGELDLTTADEFQHAIYDLVVRNSADVLLDLSDLQFCDVEGVRALVWSSRLVSGHNHRMRIIRAQPSIRETLAMSPGDTLEFAEGPEEPP